MIAYLLPHYFKHYTNTWQLLRPLAIQVPAGLGPSSTQGFGRCFRTQQSPTQVLPRWVPPTCISVAWWFRLSWCSLMPVQVPCIQNQATPSDSVNGPDELPSPLDHPRHLVPSTCRGLGASGRSGAWTSTVSLCETWRHRRTTKPVAKNNMPNAAMRSGVTMLPSTVSGLE